MDLSGDEEDHIPIPLSTIIQDTTAATTAPPLLLHPYSNNNNNNNNNNINIKKSSLTVKYKECLKNHAASIGGNATDGCGEFMPSGEEGSLEALKCSACNCHRNFHRKELEGHESSSCVDHYCYHNYNKPRKGVLISQHHQMIMPLGAIQTSESDHEMMHRPSMTMKKRFRTKFTPEQKEKMLAFANQVGWRLQKQEESVVQSFCQEIGVKRRVLKV
ncbi:hypothetical protein J5N97_012676 [Dioscorea zingiberensis]|uniref:ZF-HD dimerization-type domain-containing protein n=1 Tax=Dioscorea zingiberensis TaxID=325984 RepID=A0A9D5CRH6_9LILI|nr:hypothetical protein J5N97_012676 [Dioscorea zingiberensis]